MKTISSMFSEAPRVKNLLEYSNQYLAHIPRQTDDSSKPTETLDEHLELVFYYGKQLCALHGLDPVVENLIIETVQQLEFSNPDIASDCIAELFVNAIAFHDFGKINEYFQIDRMQQSGNPFFRNAVPEVFTPRYGHSELGAYIFLVFHLEKIKTLGLPDADQVALSALALLFCNTILLHHSPKLKQPRERVMRAQFLEKRKQLERFLKMYKGFPMEEVSNFYFDYLIETLDQFEKKKVGFTLFALLRINFSLLTSSDYFATWHYGYGNGLKTEKDWGVLSEDQQDMIIQAARYSKEYNSQAYQLFETENYSFQHPNEANESNLNTLRTEMAIEVLMQLAANPEQQIYYLEAPTGGGKTNLSLLAVSELIRANPTINKVFYVFPFTTLITQTHQVIRETFLLEDHDISLIHSRTGFQTKAEMNAGKSDEEKYDGNYGKQRRDFLQNLFVLHPVTLITHIRFFDILKSNQKDDIYLMHRLANSVVVLDELQSYPPKQWDKMIFLLEQYSRFLNIRFILMSATLPRLDKIASVRRVSGLHWPKVKDLLPNPERYFKNQNFRGRVNFRFDFLENQPENMTLHNLAEVVRQKSRARADMHDGRVFTIVEFIFKKSATEFRGLITELEKQEDFFGEFIFVLSGTILESRRREIISFLKRNRKTPGMKVLLITTQVVEAGVDIDMDLGFKNVSLIDSDEQLAGRVNRNVSKDQCAVYLFKINEAHVLYGHDLRYNITRTLPPSFHREILESKNFEKLYSKVFDEIEKINRSQMVENFTDNYLRLLQILDFQAIHDKFRLIEQSTLSVFVPVALPVHIENENGALVPFFSSFELKFLNQCNAWESNSASVDGNRIWRLFQEMTTNPKADFIKKKIEQKIMQGILAKFTFSLFESDKNRLGLRSYCDETDCFENYYYLTRHTDLYTLEDGLNESKLIEPEFIF